MRPAFYAAMALAAGCASVPDVSFYGPDGATDDGSTTAEAGGDVAASDDGPAAGDGSPVDGSPFDASDDAAYCSGNPPPPGGKCCPNGGPICSGNCTTGGCTACGSCPSPRICCTHGNSGTCSDSCGGG